ncbi:ran guanine nucleotide release factor-like [Symsagittifera roscoffensis]|uniref:ran guanine nucleotide release factor-like n=1 Tax=Symsagittifera roscoffensis TaxID=84072 RepID=UPI00307BA515
MALLFKEQGLFGGALKCSFPQNFYDASDVRPVPDNQEVFMNKQCNQNIIFDILESPAAQNDLNEHPATFHFKELVEDHELGDISDGIEDTDLFQIDPENFTKECIVEISTVRGVKKRTHRDGSLENIRLTVVVFRILIHKTDIVVTFNDSEFEKDGESDQKWSGDNFVTILRSLKLIDSSLFVDE